MEYVGKKLTLEDLRQFEDRIGFSLPDSYRSFLLKFNGGRPNPYHFLVKDCYDPHSLINEFNGIMLDSENVLDNDLEEYIEIFEFRIPRGFMAIASDPGGNTVLLSLDGSTKGNIYFWEHNYEPEDCTDNVEDYPNIYFLANDFEEFLNQLY